MRVHRWPAGLAAAAILLAGCSMFSDEERLEGERIPVRGTEQSAGPALPEGGVPPLPAPARLSDWTQVNGTASHNSGHIAGSAGLTRAWSVDAGEGGGSRAEITGSPIVVGGRIYVLDAAAEVSSFDAASGAAGWSASLVPPGQRGREGFGGGLAAVGGRIFATTGFGEVLALDAATGEIAWRQSFPAPFRAAPAAVDGVVVAVARDNEAFGLDPASGKLKWRLQGATADAGLLGGASPAIAGNVAVIPYASGEIAAAVWPTGQPLWTAVVSGGRRGLARSAITDVTGDPVIVGPLVVAANQSGRTVAIEGQTGRRVWTRSIGSTGPIWAAGEALFVMGDDARLVRLSARNGATVWSAQLQPFRDMDAREGAIGYSGPVLVGGRVLVTDDRGTLFAFDADTGREAGRADIGDGSLVGPVAAGGLVYVLARDATLYAFR